MATDARFDKIQKIVPHDNADALEIAIVSSFPCVVRKGEFAEGDWCFYIRDDAKLVGYDEKKNGKDCTFPWQENLLSYLGGGGRVKTIKLRGKISMGILLKPEVVMKEAFDDAVLQNCNLARANPDSGAKFLETMFGVKHWTAPQTNIGDLNILHCGLEDGVKKSDEENWENLDEADLHLGAQCLVTKKLDGTSCTVICRADGTYAIASRSNTLKPECDNVYTKYTKEAVAAGLWYAKKFNTTIAFQGEVCCQSVQRFGINKDKELNDYFIYKCYSPNSESWHEKMGTYGSATHFLNVVGICNKEGGFSLKTVPVLDQTAVTKDLLKKYNDMPADFGEGVVINVRTDDINDMSSLVWDYKSKSREYLMKIK